ncbi:hypothetical protein [Azospirillum sp. TSH100]|uniref:hypothetical protein n=1 Tax=Azospirillum sp. TSH100 TaxID=652764 RepID=UPI0010A99EA2|nr:hypothetical protein [Azospirillum sp. TSH100]QCG90030.1 hypothetical protein E6C72_19860 [Azospirillum sp. TSH100]
MMDISQFLGSTSQTDVTYDIKYLGLIVGTATYNLITPSYVEIGIQNYSIDLGKNSIAFDQGTLVLQSWSLPVGGQSVDMLTYQLSRTSTSTKGDTTTINNFNDNIESTASLVSNAGSLSPNKQQLIGSALVGGVIVPFGMMPVKNTAENASAGSSNTQLSFKVLLWQNLTLVPQPSS